MSNVTDADGYLCQWGGIMGHKEKSLEQEIEDLREKLHLGSPHAHDLRQMDPRTYALSLKLDKLIIQYMKREKTETS